MLIAYYSLEDIEKKQDLDDSNEHRRISQIKIMLLKTMKDSHIDLKYNTDLIERIEGMGILEMQELWNKLKEKLSSPYKNKDIYDYLVFDN